MVLTFLKKIFGSDSSEQQTSTQTQASGQPEITQFVRFVVCALVDNPDEVSIKADEKDRQVGIQVACAKKDIGKVIGKNGKTIAAIRALANGAGGRLGKKVNVEILD